MSVVPDIRSLAKAWLDQDRDSSTRKEIQDLLNANNEDELERRLRNRITFGTAGLRSSMKAGFAHMNSLTVLQASQGLAQYIIDQNRPTQARLAQLKVVVGYDARHNSAKFARLAASTFLAKGLSVLWFESISHTPLVPFAVKQYGAAAGVMVTASHNPKNDNGYKVYWSNGCQIIPPHDAGIAASINLVHEILSWDTDIENKDGVENVLIPVTESYFQSIKHLASQVPSTEHKIPFTYTPMHGVGLPFMLQAADILGFRKETIRVVEAQAQPDPEFPTVPFPNPEEKGALAMATQEADRDGITLVIANDPDADRFSVAERIDDHKWHQFSGNQIGILLGSYVFESYRGDISKLAMLASTVSSRMLAAMARHEGFRFQETLTGFKWLGNVAQTLQREGFHVAYAFEEAIGFMFPEVVWDKDGIAAATVFLTAWQSWQENGLTPWRKLQALYEKYGYFEDANTYLISPSPLTTTKVFSAIRVADNGRPPKTLGKRNILRWRDLTVGFDTAAVDNVPDLPVDPTAQMITCELDNVVFTVRGSGTEPKIKLYIEGTAGTSAEAKRLAESVLEDLLQEWFQPEKYGLKLAGA